MRLKMNTMGSMSQKELDEMGPGQLQMKDFLMLHYWVILWASTQGGSGAVILSKDHISSAVAVAATI